RRALGHSHWLAIDPCLWLLLSHDHVCLCANGLCGGVPLELADGWLRRPDGAALHAARGTNSTGEERSVCVRAACLRSELRGLAAALRILVWAGACRHPREHQAHAGARLQRACL